MLKAPIRKIGGYGLFHDYREMTASEAWERYGLANGGYDLGELVERVQKYAEKNVANFTASTDPLIGCIILSDPVLLDDNDFFAPEDYGFEFSKNVVKYKTFDASEIPFSIATINPRPSFALVEPEDGSIRRVPQKDRKGQPGFRSAVLRAYGKRCAITKTAVTETLQAAHIQPYINEKSNHVQNGLCLRADLHALFDEGLIAIDDDYCVLVSEKLRRMSSAYGALEGRKLRLPKDQDSRPVKAAIQFHRENIFTHLGS
jgi:putative restriction endonuclease